MPNAHYPPSRSALSPWAHLKWQAFRLLEAASDLRGNSAVGQFEMPRPARPEAAIWVFVSTIGELNAIGPWLRELRRRAPSQGLVLITDHAHYRDSYAAQFPDARICVSHGHSRDAVQLAKHYPPTLLVVAEIPCLPADAPCRFSFAFLREAKRRGAAAVVVNGWLYGYAPACRMDAVERRWFERDYLRGFDMVCVQTDESADRLRACGVSEERLAVCGNIKFDALDTTDWQWQRTRSPSLLHALLSGTRPVIVAGCVTSASEQNTVLEAYQRVREQRPDALLVLAPRHPEVTERMLALRALLRERALVSRFRSDSEDAPIPPDCSCLVLDVLGELRDFYAAATIAHVGVDHNVLEPLRFARPTTVLTGWESSYPSYPVYRYLLEAGVLHSATDADALAGYWRRLMTTSQQQAQAWELTLQRAKGATQRHFEALEHLLPRKASAGLAAAAADSPLSRPPAAPQAPGNPGHPEAPQ